MNKTQAGRLLTLARFLRTEVPKENFDMQWFVNAGEGTPPTTNDLIEHKCGTTACALGWATVVLPDVITMKTLAKSPIRYDCEVFGLEGGGDWAHLFGSDNDRTPKQEAAVIEKFVESKGWVYA